ncbi:MAG: TIM barrel protein [Fimbriimonadaceae bacterium]|nr:TIM barrel protein [Fimbriimonadaceae bacterium]
MPVRQSFCYPLFQVEGLSLNDLFREAADIGYAATELWGWDETLDDLAEAVHHNGLVLASMCGHASLPDGLNRRENHDRIETELRVSIDKAADLGVPGLICFSGNRNPDQSDAEGLAECVRGLRRIAPYAEEKGVNLNVELLNSRVDHPGYQCDRTDWGLALCEAVDSPRVKLLFDVYHMQIMEGDVIRNLRRIGARLGHVHTAGNPGRHDLDDDQELNYRGVCRALAAMGYPYFVGHEFMAKGDRLAALRTAFEVCA